MFYSVQNKGGRVYTGLKLLFKCNERLMLNQLNGRRIDHLRVIRPQGIEVEQERQFQICELLKVTTLEDAHPKYIYMKL